MTATPLALLKAQLNLDHDLDDALLEHKLAAAEAWIETYTGGSFAATLPAMTEAALQLAALWYEQREAATFGSSGAPVPYGVRELLSPYREAVTGHVRPADALRWRSMMVGETLDFTADWRQRLGPTDTIVSAAWTVPSNLQLDRETIDATATSTTIWVTALAPGQCEITVRVVTELGRAFIEIIRLSIEDRRLSYGA